MDIWITIIPILMLLLGFLMTIAALCIIVYERNRAFWRERSLIHGIMAKSLLDWAQTNSNLLSTPDDIRKNTALENRLAELASALHQSSEEGIPLS